MKKQSVKFIIKESNINFHNWYTTAEGFSHPVLKKYAGVTIDSWLMKVENDTGNWGPEAGDWQRAGEYLLSRLLDGRLPLDKYYADHKEVGKKIFNLCDEILHTGIKNASNKKIENWLKKLWGYYYYLNAIGFVAVISDFEHNLLTNTLTEIVTSKSRAGIIPNNMSLLASPNKKTLYWQEQLELLALCKKHKNLKKLLASSGFKNHVQKYFWLNYGYQGPTWTEQDFLERAQNFFKSRNLAKDYQTHLEYFSQLTKAQKTLAKKLELNEREQYLFEVARKFTYLKGFRIETRHRYSFVLDSLFAEIGRRFYLPITFFHYALREEILEVLHKKAVNSQAVINRKKLMVYAWKNFKGTFIPTRRIPAYLGQALFEDKVSQQDTINGQSAYAGMARGKVRIVASVADLGKVSHGDILVAHGTNPDFLPAMYRASAFVTEQGGITSHAAIVAREMKKPCIIGTKIATKIFIDGDLVEVDANKGIVTKIRKK